MSEYLAIKAQIEELQTKLESARRAELAEQVTDIKKKLVAFGITPDMIFSREDLKALMGPSNGRPRKKYTNGNGEFWSGRGFKPTWISEGLAAGKKLEDFLISKPGGGGHA